MNRLNIRDLLAIYDEKNGDWCAIAREVEERTIAACNEHHDTLELIDIKAQAGLCQFSHQGTRAFLQDIRDIVAMAGVKP